MSNTEFLLLILQRELFDIVSISLQSHSLVVMVIVGEDEGFCNDPSPTPQSPDTQTNTRGTRFIVNRPWSGGRDMTNDSRGGVLPCCRSAEENTKKKEEKRFFFSFWSILEENYKTFFCSFSQLERLSEKHFVLTLF